MCKKRFLHMLAGDADVCFVLMAKRPPLRRMSQRTFRIHESNGDHCQKSIISQVCPTPSKLHCSDGLPTSQGVDRHCSPSKKFERASFGVLISVCPALEILRFPRCGMKHGTKKSLKLSCPILLSLPSHLCPRSSVKVC